MNSRIISLGLLAASLAGVTTLYAAVGADLPWTTYEAEDMKTSGTVLGPKYAPFQVETEASHQKCVKLGAAGGFVEFTAAARANALVIRYHLPDSKDGGGVNSTLGLFINGKRVRTLSLTSHYALLYGAYPFTNQPKDGRPRNFFDELRVKDIKIGKGDVVRLQKTFADAPHCIIDLVDLEQVAPLLAAPKRSLSVLEFGAGGTGTTDDTEALRNCIIAAQRQGKTVYVPSGDYKLTGNILLPSNVKIQGAGMWHTTFVGDADLYGQADKRVCFKLTGTNIHLADFAIFGKLNYRNDNEPNDGIVGAGCADSTLSRIWVEHTKAGAWIYNGTRLVIDGCRFRNLLADGVNFCVGTRESVVQNSSTRGTGDDCFAMWPAPADQGFPEQSPKPGQNIFRHCTGQLTFLANGGAIYGGADNKIEDCLFTDISTGCGILLSTTFPTADEALKIDNNFSGTTVVKNVDLIRCGGFDHGWTWRGAFQLCMHKRSISGLALSNISIRDSFSDGLTVVAPECSEGRGILGSARLENVSISNFGLGAKSRHGLFIREDAAGSMTLHGCQIDDVQNSSARFTIGRE